MSLSYRSLTVSPAYQQLEQGILLNMKIVPNNFFFNLAAKELSG